MQLSQRFGRWLVWVCKCMEENLLSIMFSFPPLPFRGIHFPCISLLSGVPCHSSYAFTVDDGLPGTYVHEDLVGRGYTSELIHNKGFGYTSELIQLLTLFWGGMNS